MAFHRTWTKFSRAASSDGWAAVCGSRPGSTEVGVGLGVGVGGMGSAGVGSVGVARVVDVLVETVMVVVETVMVVAGTVMVVAVEGGRLWATFDAPHPPAASAVRTAAATPAGSRRRPHLPRSDTGPEVYRPDSLVVAIRRASAAG